MRGHSHSLETLLESEADVNLIDKQNRTALHWACAKSHATCAHQILEKINDDLISWPDEEGKTALHIAAKNGLPSVVGSLIDRGANLVAECKEGYWPALSCAATKETADCLRIIMLAMLPSGSDSSILSSRTSSIGIASSLCPTKLNHSVAETDDMHVDD